MKKDKFSRWEARLGRGSVSSSGVNTVGNGVELAIRNGQRKGRRLYTGCTMPKADRIIKLFAVFPSYESTYCLAEGDSGIYIWVIHWVLINDQGV